MNNSMQNFPNNSHEYTKFFHLVEIEKNKIDLIETEILRLKPNIDKNADFLAKEGTPITQSQNHFSDENKAIDIIEIKCSQDLIDLINEIRKSLETSLYLLHNRNPQLAFTHYSKASRHIIYIESLLSVISTNVIDIIKTQSIKAQKQGGASTRNKKVQIVNRFYEKLDSEVAKGIKWPTIGAAAAAYFEDVNKIGERMHAKNPNQYKQPYQICSGSTKTIEAMLRAYPKRDELILRKSKGTNSKSIK